MILITAAQMRAGRALVKWSAEKLADQARLGVATVRRAENADENSGITEANCQAIRTALEEAGVQFIDENGGGAGVRLREAGQPNIHPKHVGPASDAIERMERDIQMHKASRKR